jgi:trk system potassium uptake protein
MRVIIVGQSKTIYFLAREFASQGYAATIICNDRAKAMEFSRQLPKATVMYGDGTSARVLREAEANQADVLVALQEADQDNLVTCQLGKHLFDIPRTITLINDPEHEEVFQKLGVSVALSAAKILGQMIREQVSFEEIQNLLSLEGGLVTVSELILPPSSPVVGKTLAQLSLPSETLIAAIIRGDIVIIPRGTAVLQAADKLLLVAKSATQGELLRRLTGHEG